MSPAIVQVGKTFFELDAGRYVEWGVGSVCDGVYLPGRRAAAATTAATEATSA